MTITANRLASTAGICAAAAGALFAGVQIGHPPVDVEHIGTTEMTLRETAKIVMCVLALIGFTGMFLRHRNALGVLGLAGFPLLTVGFLAMFANQCIVALVLPTVAATDPGYVQAYIDGAMGQSSGRDLGHLDALFLASGIGFSIGGLLFGIALLRARVLARWAAALLAVGTTSVLALSALPASFDRPFAVPTAVALIGLGISLWRDGRRSETAVAPAMPLVAEPATR